MNKNKKITFKTRDFSVISLSLLIITALAISSNFNFDFVNLSQKVITSDLNLLVEAQKNYKKEFNTFATTFDDLNSNGMLEQEYLASAKKGYEFRLEYGSLNSFTFTANPKKPSVSNRYYYVDESGVIRYNLNSPADSNSSPIDG